MLDTVMLTGEGQASITVVMLKLLKVAHQQTIYDKIKVLARSIELAERFKCLQQLNYEA